ncbi:MAG TPA: hypothetical protein VHA76_15565 [Solirubrobacterales bacterium]|nr:hypothetical protein [Solirubrobacterales bacterium]
MNSNPAAGIGGRHRDPVSWAALIVAIAALVFSVTGQAPAGGVPAAAKGSKAKKAQKAAGATKNVQCPVSNAITFGSWCLESSPHPVPISAEGQNNYFYAAQTCVKEGGWLPSAAQLIGAAPEVPLQSTLDDDPGSSGAEEFPEASRGIVDKREMSGDLFTTTAGAEAAGSEGVSVGARGNTTTGEPDPVPAPANPSPETLDYITVYDNHNQGGFAGGEPVSKPESFRCAYAVGSTKKPKASRTN